MLVTKRLAVIVTLRCTLKCKLCCNCVTMYKNPPMLDKKEIMSDIDSVFALYNRIEWFQFVGGEPFLHPNMEDLVKKALEYKSQFQKLVFMTNGTVLPNSETIEILKQNKDLIEIQISDYGKLSRKLDELVDVLSKNEIPFVIKMFHGDMQHYGGWIDTGDFSDKGERPEELEEKFQSCWQNELENLHMYNGKLHNCSRAVFALDLGLVDIPENEYIDLRSDKYSLEEKRKVAENFNKKVLTACKYCNGFVSKNTKRYPAAEQL